jgi:hypothetical protein
MTPMSKERSCEGKVRHAERGAAVRAAEKLLRKDYPEAAQFMTKGAFRRLRKEWCDAYECVHCGGFHVGHVPKEIRESYGDYIPKPSRSAVNVAKFIDSVATCQVEVMESLARMRTREQ